MTILRPGDLLTAIRIPSTWADARFYFEKVRDRNVWDLPLLNVASAMQLSGDTIERIRIAWFLIGVAALAGLALLIMHAIYVRYFAKAEKFAGDVHAALHRVPS